MDSGDVARRRAASGAVGPVVPAERLPLVPPGAKPDVVSVAQRKGGWRIAVHGGAKKQTESRSRIAAHDRAPAFILNALLKQQAEVRHGPNLAGERFSAK